MKQYILRSLLVAWLALPAAAFAAPEQPAEAPATAMAESVTEVSLQVKGRSVQVVGAMNGTLEVFDITGKCVCSVRIDSNDKTVALNLRKGWYILRVEKDKEKLIRKVLLP
ncbi:MAG: T9SS type A sorting domain-containing protein, partial [Alloprevotella sp.]